MNCIARRRRHAARHTSSESRDPNTGGSEPRVKMMRVLHIPQQPEVNSARIFPDTNQAIMDRTAVTDTSIWKLRQIGCGQKCVATAADVRFYLNEKKTSFTVCCTSSK